MYAASLFAPLQAPAEPLIVSKLGAVQLFLLSGWCFTEAGRAIATKSRLVLWDNSNPRRRHREAYAFSNEKFDQIPTHPLVSRLGCSKYASQFDLILKLGHPQLRVRNRIVVMKEGVVHQCGPPLEVYNRPANRFVAGFIGTPSMNFLEGHIEFDGQSRTFSGSVGRFGLPTTLVNGCEASDGQSMVLGIRPEHVRLSEANGTLEKEKSTGKCNASTVAATLPVRVVETLGDCIHVHLTTPAGEPIVARVSPTIRVAPQQRVPVLFDLQHAHLFAVGEHGRRLNTI